MINLKWFIRLFTKKERYVLRWSDTFNAWQVYQIEINSKPFFKSFHSPSYFRGWAVNKDTDFKSLNKFESMLEGRQYKWI